MLTALSCAGAPPLPCFVELPIYDAQGNRITLEVVKVTAIEPPEKGDLLRSNGPHRMVWKDNRLYFAQGIAVTGIEVTLDGGRDARGRRVGFTQKLELYDCQQRVSLEYGERDAGGDVAATTVRGRISGCPLDGDWWIRAMPMFGPHYFSRALFDGYVRKSDGSVSIIASMQGERHVIVVGHGRDPIISFSFDVVEGGRNNDFGTIDLRGKCPNR
jgi:hypothetical protein